VDKNMFRQFTYLIIHGLSSFACVKVIKITKPFCTGWGKSAECQVPSDEILQRSYSYSLPAGRQACSSVLNSATPREGFDLIIEKRKGWVCAGGYNGLNKKHFNAFYLLLSIVIFICK
jgi:hypothetical protein